MDQATISIPGNLIPTTVSSISPGRANITFAWTDVVTSNIITSSVASIKLNSVIVDGGPKALTGAGGSNLVIDSFSFSPQGGGKSVKLDEEAIKPYQFKPGKMSDLDRWMPLAAGTPLFILSFVYQGTTALSAPAAGFTAMDFGIESVRFTLTWV